MSKAYTSNLTRDQFELIEPLLPAAKPGGRPRSVCLWAVLNAIFYLVAQGCSWRDLPGDFPAWQTVYTYYRNWVKDGTWDALHDRPESPSEVILDSQSVAAAPMVHRSVGDDVAKATKGRKRHLVVDTLGLMMAVVVTAASVPERAGGQQALQKLHQMGERAARVYLVWTDGGYSGPIFLQWVMDTLGWIVHVVLRPQESKGFVLLKKRWVVERTFGWWRWSRRLVQDYEQLPENAEAMLHIAMIRIMLRRLA
ncbi:IS5 family transposase [Nodosilinea sp. E11]|uniref:IS5 family transposase n=1 Tax=Nodosilinea sp. E11 TaxID=3037479 RepID=UPI002934BF29|nr:IS5 family transposase [Nodosilinea sp. E11]WOD40571.1 IS5 family transposase [Nodosilinea sp. E11]